MIWYYPTFINSWDCLALLTPVVVWQRGRLSIFMDIFWDLKRENKNACSRKVHEREVETLLKWSGLVWSGLVWFSNWLWLTSWKKPQYNSTEYCLRFPAKKAWWILVLIKNNFFSLCSLERITNASCGSIVWAVTPQINIDRIG